MGYVITAVGAGGKTTYLRNRAGKCLREGKSVVITTSTHMWAPRKENAFQRIAMYNEDDSIFADAWFGMGEEPDYCGHLQNSGKLSALSDEEIGRLAEEYDVVLVEGDGSHCMPAKIPGENEPVITACTDEIVVVMGAHAIGRRVDVVCHRYELVSKDAEHESLQGRVTEQMLREIADRFYIEKLRCEYPRAKIIYVLSRMPHPEGRIMAVVMASGFGRRYGGNKLLDLYEEKPLYLHALEHIAQAFGLENMVVVTQYDQIADEVGSMGIDAIMNDQAEEGIAASIRLGTEWAARLGADAVMFFAADMPSLPPEEIRLYARQFLSSGKPFGCMVFGPEHICSNPGAFRLDTGAEKLMRLTGDKGAMRIMKQEPWNIYYYQIAPECCEDIDRPDP